MNSLLPEIAKTIAANHSLQLNEPEQFLSEELLYQWANRHGITEKLVDRTVAETLSIPFEDSISKKTASMDFVSRFPISVSYTHLTLPTTPYV